MPIALQGIGKSVDVSPDMAFLQEGKFFDQSIVLGKSAVMGIVAVHGILGPGDRARFSERRARLGVLTTDESAGSGVAFGRLPGTSGASGGR